MPSICIVYRIHGSLFGQRRIGRIVLRSYIQRSYCYRGINRLGGSNDIICGSRRRRRYCNGTAADMRRTCARVALSFRCHLNVGRL